VLQKCRRNYQLFFGLQLVSKEFHHSAIQTKIEQNFGGFFHEIKVRQPIGGQDSLQTVIQTSRIGFNSAWSGSELWSLLNIQKWNYKLKPIAVDVLFKA
jgi:hypothetical protein